MSELITTTNKAAYRPEPCRACGARVRVVGWDDVSQLTDRVTVWAPKRRCTDATCESNGGSLASPPA